MPEVSLFEAYPESWVYWEGRALKPQRDLPRCDSGVSRRPPGRGSRFCAHVPGPGHQPDRGLVTVRAAAGVDAGAPAPRGRARPPPPSACATENGRGLEGALAELSAGTDVPVVFVRRRRIGGYGPTLKVRVCPSPA